LGAACCCGACVLNREFARVHLQKGDVALAENNLDVALAEFKDAVKLDPRLAEGHRKLGSAYRRAGRLDDAAESLEAAVQLDPFDFGAFFELGEVYRLLDQMTQAIRAYVMACKLQPREFQPRFRLATAYHRGGDLEQAIEQYNEALKVEPRSAHAWSNLGAAYGARGLDYEAIRAYKRSLECETNQPVVLVNLATVYLNQERFATAQRTLVAALRIAPNLSLAHERLGYCHWRGQRYDEAATDYQTAIELNEKNSRAFAGYGVVRMTQYLKDPEQVAYRAEAIESWHRSLEVDPDQPKLRALIQKYRVKPERPVLSLDE
jgi:tetratricopeptide (TPR) repeat protein